MSQVAIEPMAMDLSFIIISVTWHFYIESVNYSFSEYRQVDEQFAAISRKGQ